jgi:hypothetical protein
MTIYMAAKFHYDHRVTLPHYLKYSRESTTEEYQQVLDLYYEEGIGGEGFHECLNFNKAGAGETKIYLPPGYVPASDKCDNDFIIFSFTYKGDKELPSHVIGVHANVSILSREGIKRKNTKPIEDIGDLTYHAIAPSNLSTLFSTPLFYDFKEDKYTPAFKSWGNGLKYITEKHAINILQDALNNAIELHKEEKCQEKNQYLEEEINVISSILRTYFNVISKKAILIGKSYTGGLPDKEIGHLGEEFVFNEELEYAKKNNIDPVHIQWLSQSIPSSVYDIKTVRIRNGKLEDYYIEVKSTKLSDYSNIHISSRQIDFFESNPKNSIFIFIKFDYHWNVVEKNTYHINDLKKQFQLHPIKYKLIEKGI